MVRLGVIQVVAAHIVDLLAMTLDNRGIDGQVVNVRQARVVDLAVGCGCNAKGRLGLKIAVAL